MPARTALFDTGRMGTPIGACFLRAGHDMVLCKPTPAKAAECAALGAVRAATRDEAGSGAHIGQVTSFVRGSADDYAWAEPAPQRGR
jgi:3-hydroxyisobutyrate dehydrogenase-like beta-hydroxyacid dehydrogenase